MKITRFVAMVMLLVFFASACGPISRAGIEDKFKFSGEGYLVVDRDPMLSGNNPDGLTVSFYMCPDQAVPEVLQISEYGNYVDILGMVYFEDRSYNWGFRLYYGEAGPVGVSFAVKDTAAGYISEAFMNLTELDWNNGCAKVTGRLYKGRPELYVADRSVASPLLVVQRGGTSTSVLRIGTWGLSTYFVGVLYDVQLYDAPVEFTSLCSDPQSCPQPLVGWYKLKSNEDRLFGNSVKGENSLWHAAFIPAHIDPTDPDSLQ